jgi:hypothetical protein
LEEKPSRQAKALPSIAGVSFAMLPNMSLRSLTILALTILALTILAIPSLAIAQEAPGVHPAMPQPVAADVPEPSQVERYGWQIGLLDTAALVMVLVGAESDEGGVAVLGAGTYVLSGPTVHLMRGHKGRALGSLALRVALPVVGAEIASAGYSCNAAVEDDCGGESMARILVGGMAGILVAGAIDWFVLSKEKRKAGSLGIQPTISPTNGGGQVGLMGVF